MFKNCFLNLKTLILNHVSQCYLLTDENTWESYNSTVQFMTQNTQFTNGSETVLELYQ